MYYLLEKRWNKNISYKRVFVSSVKCCYPGQVPIVKLEPPSSHNTFLQKKVKSKDHKMGIQGNHPHIFL